MTCGIPALNAVTEIVRFSAKRCFREWMSLRNVACGPQRDQQDFFYNKKGGARISEERHAIGVKSTKRMKKQRPALEATRVTNMRKNKVERIRVKAVDIISNREGDRKYSLEYEFMLAITKVHVKRNPWVTCQDCGLGLRSRLKLEVRLPKFGHGDNNIIGT
jgi:hypothetical protein